MMLMIIIIHQTNFTILAQFLAFSPQCMVMTHIYTLIIIIIRTTSVIATEKNTHTNKQKITIRTIIYPFLASLLPSSSCPNGREKKKKKKKKKTTWVDEARVKK
jgi:hypothetical protein